MRSELDIIRGAFNGDTAGWEEVKGMEKCLYQNKITGENRESEPEVLYIASIIKKAEQSDSLLKNYETLKRKADESILLKNEADLAILKLKAELNSFKALHGDWIKSAETIGRRCNETEKSFTKNASRVESAMTALTKHESSISNATRFVRSATLKIKAMEVVINEQRLAIDSSTSRVRLLESDVAAKQKMIDRLTRNISEEVQTKLGPIQGKLAQATSLVLQQSAMRIRDLRDIAALWPRDFLMPTILLIHRRKTPEDKARQAKRAMEHQALLALGMEIRAKVLESSQWTTAYDNYGRMYYTNTYTGISSWEQPEIMFYKPPEGYDEVGCRVIPAESHWSNQYKIVKTEGSKIYYENLDTKEVVEEIPHDYYKIKEARSLDEVVRESAKVVITFLRDKQSQLRDKKNGQEECLDQPNADNYNEFPLCNYIYDIETVEILAGMPSSASENSARCAEPESPYERLYEVADITLLTEAEIRNTLFKISEREEVLEIALRRIRGDLREYSFLLSTRVESPQNFSLLASTNTTHSTMQIIHDGFSDNSDLSGDFSLERVCADLVIMGIFCGYQGLQLSDMYSRPTPVIKDHIGDNDDRFSTSSHPEVPDDQWLTRHFFLTTSKERVDAVLQSTYHDSLFNSDVNYSYFRLFSP